MHVTTPSPVIPPRSRWNTVQSIAKRFGGHYGGEKWYFPSPALRDEFVKACAEAGIQLN